MQIRPDVSWRFFLHQLKKVNAQLARIKINKMAALKPFFLTFLSVITSRHTFKLFMI